MPKVPNFPKISDETPNFLRKFGHLEFFKFQIFWKIGVSGFWLNRKIFPKICALGGRLNRDFWQNNSHLSKKWALRSETTYLQPELIHRKSGGGSFKNRKPTGEIGCCEPGMAKRIQWWTEIQWGLLFFSSSFILWLSHYLPIYLLCIYASGYQSISLSFIYLPVYLSVCLSIYLSFYLALSFYLSLYLCLSFSFFHLSICLAVDISICQFIFFSGYLWRSVV